MNIHEENQAPYVGDLHIRFVNVFKIPGGCNRPQRIFYHCFHHMRFWFDAESQSTSILVIILLLCMEMQERVMDLEELV